MEDKIVEMRWKNIKQPKVLIAVITSEANVHCQNAWLGKVMFLQGFYDIIIFENSSTIENFKKLQFASHNYPNVIVKRGKLRANTIANKIVENRNLVLDYIRKHEEYDYVLMMDSDIFPPTQVIIDLLKHKKDITMALCYVWTNDMANTRPACNFFPADIKTGIATKWLEEGKPRLLPLAQSGLGCVMFKADILRKNSDLKFYNKKIKSKDGCYVMNEDLTFTGHLEERGYKIWLDQVLVCKHMAKGSGANGI